MLDLFPDSAQVERGELVLGGLAAAELGERFGTPLVVYCEETLRAQGARSRARSARAGSVFFGTKAFPNVAVLRLLLEEGIGADVASAGELAFARAAGLSGRAARRAREQQGRGASPRGGDRSVHRSSSTERTRSSSPRLPVSSASSCA